MTAAPTDAPGADRAAALGDFARACKSAARSVSLYPKTHPAIRAALDRLTDAAQHLVSSSDARLTVHPTAILVDGLTPSRPEPAIAELAALLHGRLIGELRIGRDADAEDWHALLLLLRHHPRS